MSKVIVHSLFSDFDIDLFKSGKHFKLYEKLGSHPMELDGVQGTYFAVWAPTANSVSVVGDFNNWRDLEHPLNVRWDGSGIWEGFIPGIGSGTLYKYNIHSNNFGIVTEKADPFAKYCEHPPKTASVVWDGDYTWKDEKWMDVRGDKNSLDKPYSVYEVHLGSWKRKENNDFLTYSELAEDLVKYVKEMGFTHVEFMPIMEFPFDPSWGYQLTGYFAPTSRFGNPEEFKFLVDKLHQAGVGVILDWVPSHFPEDAHGLGFFDGSHLYEHPDRRRGYHPDWKSLIFNYGRNEVRAFLISNALFWLDQYHVDGLRVDAVASMLYLDYSREEGEWEPNIYGNNENLEAISFIRELNETVYGNFPDVQTIAEESTSFAMVSKPVNIGGLGFGMKWMMGWMHDTLDYFSKDPVYRKYHQNDITFSLAYAFSENFMLPLSHDEVVYGKNSILGRMPGDEWQRFANLRLLYGYMFTHPG
uniref:1,4-alpha-glucan branching protein GlgB n=1 Tax=Maribacter polysiphoniae TaxID=429344 RepID=UPI00235589D4